MKIYIASSWRNQHAVEMLTALLRNMEIEVLSFVEFNQSIGLREDNLPVDEWINSEGAEKAFKYDTESAMNCDLLIYIAPSGKDAFAETGMAYARGIPILGLWAKGEEIGIAGKMITYWFYSYYALLAKVSQIHKAKIFLDNKN
jgi:hypothetical protein